MVDQDLFSKVTISAAFNRAAATYDAACLSAQEITRRALERLDCMHLNPNTILDLGGGTGYGSELLAKRYPGARIILLDIAEQMLQQAKPRLHAAPIFPICADAECLPLADASVD